MSRNLMLGALVVVVPLLALDPAHAEPANVNLSLDEWAALNAQIEQLRAPAAPPVQVLHHDRSVDGTFRRGLFTGRIELDVEVLASSGTSLPLLGWGAQVVSLLVDGKPSVAAPASNGTAVRLGPGRHRVVARFTTGRESERFGRNLKLQLPSGVKTALSIVLDEPDLDVTLQGGVLQKVASGKDTTKITAALDARGQLDVSWKQNRRTPEATRLEATTHHLASLTDELVKVRTAVQARVLSGEADRIRLEVPDDVEVTGVEGPQVLQWITDRAKDHKQLIVLLRHLVSDRVEIVVSTQSPRVRSESDAENAAVVTLSLVTPKMALREGWLAVEGRPGLEIAAKEVRDATDVGADKLPPALLDLSSRPLLYGYRFEEKNPVVTLAARRNARLTLTDALIDDLEASTVLVEEGAEITKLRLHVRNNTRQLLRMELPKGAVVTHALLDGAPFAPAIGPSASEGKQALLIPLRQSEKVAVRRHVVRPGETLGEISLRYFNQVDYVDQIVTTNPGLASAHDLTVGSSLIIPTRTGGSAFEESRFVVELAYKVPGDKMGAYGSRGLALPSLDLPVMRAAWHLYLPKALEPLRFDSNLTQLTKLRYDPVRRVLHFLDAALRIRTAWAYSNILKSRKSIWQQEERSGVTEALAAFPLVGERYRFRRVLLGEESPRVDVTWLDRDLLPVTRGLAFLLMMSLALLGIRAVARRGLLRGVVSPPVLVAFASLTGVLFVAHHVPGVHRATLLGLDAALLLFLAPWILARLILLKRAFGRPFEPEKLLRFRSLVFLLIAAIALGLLTRFPLLLSSFVLVVLATIATRANPLGSDAKEEVRHA